jgi:uncharacterized repeat protein (TIGR01451 family)
LLARGLIPEDVHYLAEDAAAPGVDAVATVATVRDAIESWALAKLTTAPAPLYLILIGPGAPNTFFLDTETVSASELGAWLDILEGMLDAEALAERRVVVVGANQSGSFIPVLSKPTRLVITTTSGAAEAYQGPLEVDAVGGPGERASELFLEELFARLGEGHSVAKAFERAGAQVRRLTRRGGFASASSPDPAAPLQHPLLDDDGDGVGSETLTDIGGDGKAAAVHYLGVATNAAQPPRLTEVTETLNLSAEQSSAVLWASTSAPVTASELWVALRPPALVVTASGSTVQPPVGLAQLPFDGFAPERERFELAFEQFNESGKYELYYFLREDAARGLAPLARSVVYKNRAGNQPPDPFDLLLPVDGATHATTLVFDWTDATDPEADALTYTLVIATDAGFTNVVHRAEELAQSLAIVDETAGLADLTTHYWKVEAVDIFGATRASAVRVFHTDNTNGFPGFISGVVQNALDDAPIAAATVSTDRAELVLTDSTGHYAMSTDAQPTDVRADKAGFMQGLASEVEVPAAANVEVNFALVPAAGADLAVTQQASPDPVLIDADVSYAVTVINQGPVEATNVVVSDVLPAGLALKSVTPDVCTQGVGTLACFVGDLPAAQEASLTITVTATAAGILDHTVNVAADETDPVAGNNADTAQTEVIDGPLTDTDGDGDPDVTDPDDDGDGIPDDVELANGLDPLDGTDAAQDNDGDGLTNAEEIALGTDLNDADSDNDGIGDAVDPDPRVHVNAPALINIIVPMLLE